MQQRLFRLLQVRKALFELRAIDFRAFIEAGVLNGDGGRDRERLCEAQVFSCKETGTRIAKEDNSPKTCCDATSGTHNQSRSAHVP